MISNSENTDSSEKVPQKHKRFWLKFSVVFSLIVILVWLIPYLFSNILFNSAIKRAFAEATKQNYSIAFNDIKINIFTREITFLQTQIRELEKADSLNLPKINFQADTLLLHNIDFQSLRKNRNLFFENINVNQLKLEIQEQGDKLKSINSNLPLNKFIKTLAISNFSLGKAELKYSNGNDSIYIPDLNLNIIQFHLDSLTDTVKSNRIHYQDIAFILKNQKLQLPDNTHSLSWEYLKLSTIEKCLELDNFKVKPYISGNKKNNYAIDIPKFRLEKFELDSLIKSKKLLAQHLTLDISRINGYFKDQAKASKEFSFKSQLNSFFNDNFNEISIDTSQITLHSGQINLPNNRVLTIAAKSNLLLNHFQFDPKDKTKYSLRDGSLVLEKVALSNNSNKQKLRFSKGDIHYKKQNINVYGIVFISDSSENKKLRLRELSLTKINWKKYLNGDKLLADKLFLKNGDYNQRYASNSRRSINNIEAIDSLIRPYFNLLKIKAIRFEDWNYSLASKAILAKNINLNINDFQLPSDSSLAFRAFDDFDSKINRLSWVSKDQKHHYLANGLESNSRNQDISIRKIQSFPRWKTLKNESLEDHTRFKLFSKNIQLKTTKAFNQIDLKDTLSFSKLSIDSLSLKQFGKSINDTKRGVKLPPIQISTFELRKASFAAYNDSSILSRLAQVNGIHLQGDSLEIYSDSLLLIHYKRLIAISKNGFYQNTEQGLSFNFKEIDFDSKDDAMGMHQVNAELATDKNGKSTHHKLKSKLVEIQGFDHNLFLQRHLISAKSFKINSPTLISKSQTKEKEQASFRKLFSPENLQNLPYLEFDRFIVRGFTWLATYTVKGITNITTFEKANFEAIDFRLSKRSFTNPDRLFFSQSINFHIGNFKQHLRNGNFLLLVADIDFSSLEKQMDFSRIEFYTLQKPGRNNYNFTIDKVSFNEINFADFQRNYSLSIENILVSKPKTNLQLYGFEENSKIKNLNTFDLYPSIEPYFSQITLNRIDIRDMNLKLKIPKGESTNTYNLGRINLQMNNFKLDSTSKAFQNDQFFYTQNTLVHLRDYTAQIEDNLYQAKFKDLRLSTRDGIILIDSFQLKPQYNYYNFAKRVGVQTDRFDIEINKVKLSGIDFQDAIFRQKYKVGKAEINQLKGEAYRDGLYPRIPDYQPPNPLQRLLALPYFIQVDSIDLNNAYFAYKEKGRNTEVPGLIFFKNLNVQILNVSNNPDFIKFGGNAVINAQALLMGTSKLDLTAHFPLLEQGKSFKLNATLEQIKMDDLEPILRPLALIRARSGIIESVDLSVEANDDYAFGKMFMLYSDMKVDVLKKSMKKGFFSSLFANALIRTGNTNTLIPRKGPIYFERNKERSLFNYWAEISILGMKTSMGLADRRTAKKVKKLQKK